MVFFFFCRQVALADLILLNKTDLVTGEELRDVNRQIRWVERILVLKRKYDSAVYFEVVLGGVRNQSDWLSAGFAPTDITINMASQRKGLRCMLG